MAKITATGTPTKYPEIGEIRVVANGEEDEIESISFEMKLGDSFEPAPFLEDLFNRDMQEGPSFYTPYQEHETMGYVLAILCEWYGGYPECWNSIQVDGEIGKEIEYDPEAIY